MQDEESLVRRAQQRDSEACAQLYEAYFDRIYRYIVFRIRNQAEAEDMTQQVFTKMLQSISSYKCQGAPFSAWLYRIAHNQVIDFFRQRQKRLLVPIDTAPAIASDNPQDLAELSIDIQQLMSATRHLTPAQQEVISLRFAGQLSIAEAARVMGKNENAIKSLQHSAVQALRKLLSVPENE